MKTITVQNKLTEEQIKQIKGKFLDESYLKYPIINTDTIVKNEQGETVMIFLKNCIPSDIAFEAFKVFRKAVAVSNNRGQAAGPIPEHIKTGDKLDGLTVGKVQGNRFWPLRKDGTLSNSPKARAVHSSIIGYADRYARIPYCSTTEYTQKFFDDYKKTLPYIRFIAKKFKEYMPERYEAQMKAYNQTHPDFKIKGTPFTTVTLNKNFRTAAHYDAGDIPEGFGNLGVLEAGEYSGAYTLMPKYGIGVDVRSCDLALFDVHELHGNTELKRIGNAERVSVVCYFRKKMVNCGSAKEELERVKYAK